MTLDLIAELLPYPSRSFMVAYEYDYRQEWIEKLWRIIVRSGPSVVSAHECNTNIPADSVASPLSNVWHIVYSIVHTCVPNLRCFSSQAGERGHCYGVGGFANT